MKTTSEQQELRELDEWIAEHVFGWKKRRNGRLVCAPNGHAEYYTTDPAAALAVLERCAEKRRHGDIQITLNQVWCVHCGDPCGYGIEGSADTLPLAIARFAKALYSA